VLTCEMFTVFICEMFKYEIRTVFICEIFKYEIRTVLFEMLTEFMCEIVTVFVCEILTVFIREILQCISERTLIRKYLQYILSHLTHLYRYTLFHATLKHAHRL
jgi:hypothetical protein